MLPTTRFRSLAEPYAPSLTGKPGFRSGSTPGFGTTGVGVAAIMGRVALGCALVRVGLGARVKVATTRSLMAVTVEVIDTVGCSELAGSLVGVEITCST